MKYYIGDIEVSKSVVEEFEDILIDATTFEDLNKNRMLFKSKLTDEKLRKILKKCKNGTFSQEDLIKKCEVKVDKILAAKECLRCRKEEPHYCETCFQEIIAENARLQKQIHDIKRILEKYEEISNIRKNKEIFPKCVICGEYIHNYIRSSKSICDKENCRKEYQRRIH